jgi:hypothetical protein
MQTHRLQTSGIAPLIVGRKSKDRMSDHTERVWRAGPATLVVVSAFTLAAAVIVPVLAYLIYRNGSAPWLPALLILLTVLALLYAWRFGFHPRLRVTDQNVEIINPFRRHSFAWNDITVIARVKTVCSSVRTTTQRKRGAFKSPISPADAGELPELTESPISSLT